MNETEETKYPVCPFCGAVMEPSQYIGYYDEFYYWNCNCDKLPVKKDAIRHGSYVCG